MRQAIDSCAPISRVSRLMLFVLAAVPGVIYAQIGGVDLDTVKAGPLDNGKMWTFEYPPAQYFAETYGFDATPDWFERARMPALRIPGCSAAFVSPYGLVATNHHCVRGAVARVSGPGEGLLDNGFYASTTEDERPIPGYYADQLIAVEDISDEVLMALDQAAKYGKHLQLTESSLICFIEYIDEENRKKYEVEYADNTSGVTVVPLFVETGN